MNMKVIRIGVCCLATISLAGISATAQTSAEAEKGAEPRRRAAPGERRFRPGNRPQRRPEPAWLMPRVEGPNLSYKTFDSKAAGEKVSYLLYLPPGYKDSQDKRYPVMYWLHGIGGSQQGVPAITARITKAIDAGKCPPFIGVFANGMVSSFYCDAARIKRPVETVIIKDLIPHVDATYRTIPEREGRLIEGFSMGGFGAAHLGFKYPELFGSVSIIDGALVNLDTMRQRHTELYDQIFDAKEERFTSEHPRSLVEKNAAAIKDKAVVRQAVGTLAMPNKALHELLTRLEIDHDYDTFPDAGHNAQIIYERLGDKNWEFYKKAFANADKKKPKD